MVDTEAARADIRFAHQYLEEFKQAPTKWQYLDFALKYINSARSKDPDATLKVKLHKIGGVGLTTIDMLEADILYYKSKRVTEEYTPKPDLHDGIKMLLRSIKLEPGLAAPWCNLAMAHIHNDDRKQAIATINEAVRRFPEDIGVRSTSDHIESQVDWGRAPPSSNRGSNRTLYIFLAIAAFLLFAFFSFISSH